MIIDAGGGTIDLSAFYMKTKPNQFEEIAPATCVSLWLISIDTLCISSQVTFTVLSTSIAALESFWGVRLTVSLSVPGSRQYSEKLQNSQYGSPDDIDYMTECFDKSTKLAFNDPSQVAFIKFGTSRDRDPSVDIKFGQLRLQGLVLVVVVRLMRTHFMPLRSDVASFFEPSIIAIQQAVREQKAAAQVSITVRAYQQSDR